jgi:hypothetical protein
LNIKSFSVIGIVIAIVLLVVLSPIKPGDLPPTIQDSVEIKDKASIEIGQKTTDDIIVKDSEMLENNMNPDFYFDENGTKHFIIKVMDIPTLG